jgi:hypothetical protein
VSKAKTETRREAEGKIARAGASRSHKTAHPDHRFRRMPITQNGACRSPIPAHRDRTKRRIAIT